MRKDSLQVRARDEDDRWNHRADGCCFIQGTGLCQAVSPYELLIKNIDNKTVLDMDTTEEIREILLLQEVKRNAAKQALLADPEEAPSSNVN